MNHTNESQEENAKMRTIEELKAAEERKEQAAASLQQKLAQLKASLPVEEQAALDNLLTPISQNFTSESGEEVSVFFKPMQGHRPGGGGAMDKMSVFFKPMQGHGTGTGGGRGSEISVFFKPMQIVAGGTDEIAVFFKPMQGHSTGGGGISTDSSKGDGTSEK